MNDLWVAEMYQFEQKFQKLNENAYRNHEGKVINVYRFTYAFWSYNVERIIETLYDTYKYSKEVRTLFVPASAYLRQYYSISPVLPCHFVIGSADVAIIIRIKQLDDMRVTNISSLYR